MPITLTGKTGDHIAGPPGRCRGPDDLGTDIEDVSLSELDEFEPTAFDPKEQFVQSAHGLLFALHGAV